MIVVDTERLLPLRLVTQYLKGRGASEVHAKVPYRWAQGGLQGIKLETLQVGGQLHTSAEALQRLFEALPTGR